jgi:hypothetical protein
MQTSALYAMICFEKPDRSVLDTGCRNSGNQIGRCWKIDGREPMNSEKAAVLVDSGCDIAQECIDKYGLWLLPLHIDQYPLMQMQPQVHKL